MKSLELGLGLESSLSDEDKSRLADGKACNMEEYSLNMFRETLYGSNEISNGR